MLILGTVHMFYHLSTSQRSFEQNEAKIKNGFFVSHLCLEPWGTYWKRGLLRAPAPRANAPLACPGSSIWTKKLVKLVSFWSRCSCSSGRPWPGPASAQGLGARSGFSPGPWLGRNNLVQKTDFPGNFYPRKLFSIKLFPKGFF